MVTRLFSNAFLWFNSKISSLPNCLHRNNPLILIKKNRKIALLGSLGCAMYVANLEAVPYTNRRRLVLVPIRIEMRFGEMMLEDQRRPGELDGKTILPASHADRVKAEKIAKDVIKATCREMRKDRHRRAQTAHLEEFNWEVFVVDDPTGYAALIPGGKIVVHTGLLREAESDAEVAAVIGHAVGHAVARHHVELILPVLGNLMLEIVKSSVGFEAHGGIPEFSESYKSQIEAEADYIGLLLSACAGYDPETALEFWKRSAAEKENGSESEEDDGFPYIDEERAQLLSHPKIMEEALSLYREALLRSDSQSN